MASQVLTRRDEALSPDQIGALLRDRLGDHVLDVTSEYATLCVVCDPEGYVEAARLCRDEPKLAFDLFDCLFGIDARDDGFEVAVILYSTHMGHRIVLKTLAPGGRDAPRCPTLTHLFRGADWMEREAWDMFGIEFEGHPNLAPRIFTVENFEGWPLRKDFYLASRAVKPWPGVKEPVELDEEGNKIERVPGPGDAPGPTELDKAMGEQAKRANPSARRGPAADTTAGVEQTAAAEHATDDPRTEEGEVVAAEAGTADTAADSGRVVAGDQEDRSESAEETASHAKIAEGEEAASDEATTAAERAGDDERAAAEASDAAAAQRRADEQRKDAAAARQRKAAERAAAAERGDAGGDDGDATDSAGDEEAGR